MAEPLATVVVAALMAWVAQATGYPLAETPAIEFATPEEMVERGNLPHGLDPLGIYVIKDRLIMLDDQLDLEVNLCARSILVHEVVHHLQFSVSAFAGYSLDDRKWLREREANQIQMLWLAEEGVYRVTPYILTEAYFDENKCWVVPGAGRRLPYAFE